MSSAISAYFSGLNLLIIVTALVILVSGLDDLFIDVVYWSRRLARLLVGPREAPLSVEALRSKPERYLAIMVPAWKEAEVIAHMAENTLRTLEYDKYVVFLGTYRNDAETTAEADKMCARSPDRIVRATVDRDGPTCKADCLNWILRSISAYEKTHNMEFAGLIMHDCEDVVHPLELKYFNSQIDQADMIQLPVMSLELPWTSFVGAAYMDDFSESHQKDIRVREYLTGIVPGAGVALCYSRRAIAAMMAKHDGQPFNTSSLTEDYDFSYRLARLGGMKQHFAGDPVEYPTDNARGLWWKRPATSTGLLATCEYFPSEFRAAYRQRARWVLGISFLGWRQLGWEGSFWTKYMFMRDRKGILTAPFSVLAYFVLANALMVTELRGNELFGKGAQSLVFFEPWIQPLLWINLSLLTNRVLERIWFVSKVNGLQQGLMSVPRMVFTNFINFGAVSRAWNQWITHLRTGAPIAWDKTKHTFPTNAELAHNRRRLGDLLVERGAITAAELESALARQKASGEKLGKVLLEGGRVTPDLLADAVAEQQQLPRAMRNTQPMAAVLGAIDPAVMRKHELVPFSMASNNTLQVAVKTRPDSSVTARIRAASGYQVAYVVACDHEVEAWVNELAPQSPPEVPEP